MRSRIVILGGGPAGIALAAAFIKRNFSVTVIEKSDYQKYKHGEHVPSVLLNLFYSLSIPKSFLIDNSIRCNGILGFWAGKEIVNHGLFNRNGFDFILNRPAFDYSLCQYIENLGVKVYSNAKQVQVNQNEINLNNNLRIPFDFIFDCTGRTSSFHNNTRLIFDNLIGITCELPNGTNNLTDSEVIIDSTENGWWYSVSNSSNSICTFFTDNDIYRNIDFNINSELKKSRILNDKYKELIGNKHIMPCYTSILKTLPNRIFQVGDSFASYDPLSSLGIYKAFENAIAISEAFEKNNEDLSSTYQNFQNNFLKYIDIRNEFYHQGHSYFDTEFYKRRIIINN